MIISRLLDRPSLAIFSHGLCHAIAVMPGAIFTSGSPWQQSGRSLDEAVTKFRARLEAELFCRFSVASSVFSLQPVALTGPVSHSVTKLACEMDP
jgi:hypothetical protein